MKINRWFRRMLHCALAVMMLLPMYALAQGKIDVSKDITLSIIYKSGSTKLEGAGFDLYKVADMNEFGYFTIEPEFDEYSVDMDGLKDFSSQQWKDLAMTLSGYVRRDKIPSMCSGVTDANGELKLASSSNALGAGMYLVTGDAHDQGGFIYTPEPFMVALPAMENDKNDWDYDLEVVPKFESIEDAPIDRKVLKVWNDDGYTYRRPDKITVELLKDDQIYDSVILNADNHWSHEWIDLDPHAVWNVVEKDVPSTYKVSISRTGITFVITNRTSGGGGGGKDPDPDPDPKPKNPPTETITDGDVPLSDGEPFGILDIRDDEQIPLAALPATGTTWWLVGILACSGMILFGTGYYKNRRYGNYEE